MKTKTRSLFPIRLPFSMFAAVSFMGVVSAADITWDLFGSGPSDSIITGGTGLWDTSTTNWTNDAGVSNTVWNNVNNDVAIFGDVAGSVTLSGPITAGGITFNTTGYSVTGSTLILADLGRVVLPNDVNATISSIIDGTAGLRVGIDSTTAIETTNLGTLTLTNANIHTGVTTLHSGTINIQNPLAFGGIADGTVIENGAGLSFQGGVTVADEPLTARGAGAYNSGGLRNISGDNSWTGLITLSNSLRVTSDSGTLTLGSAAIAQRGFIMTGPGNITVEGALTGTSGSILVDNLANEGVPGGTMTLKGANVFTGATTVTNGTLNLEGNRTEPAGALVVGNGGVVAGQTGTLNLKNGTFSAAGITVGSSPNVAAQPAGIGILNQTAGALSTAGLILLGNAGGANNLDASGTGTYNLSDGSLTTSSSNVSAICLSTNNNGTGTFNLSGTGLLEMTGTGFLQIGRSSSTTTNTSGTFNQTGGTALIARMAMGGVGNTANSSLLDISNGTFTVSTDFTVMAAGANSSAVISISGNAIVTLPAFPTARGADSTATITFDGGTLKPTAASTSYMSGLTDGSPEAVGATIQDGGVTFEVATGNDIVIAQDLDSHPVSLGGGLTKTGAGVLGLSGANTYTGATTVSQGTLALTGGSQVSAISVLDGAFLGFDLTSSSITSTSSVTLSANARVRIVSTPTLASYTLMTAASFSADPQLETPIAGYELVVDGTELKLNSTGASGYSTWAAAFTSPALSDTAANADPDNDGLDNLVEYALGLDPRFSSPSPGVASNGGKTITFTKGAEAKVNLDVTYKIETSISLGAAPTPWTDDTAPDVTEDADTIAITFSSGPASNFARLKVVKIP